MPALKTPIFLTRSECAEEFQTFARQLVKTGLKCHWSGANMTEFGKTPFLRVSDLKRFAIVVHLSRYSVADRGRGDRDHVPNSNHGHPTRVLQTHADPTATVRAAAIRPI